MVDRNDKVVWPEIAPDLKYTELRLPGTFRELCADQRFTNEEIGRIARSIAMGTDAFLTQHIEPDVFYYRKALDEREKVRRRVAKFRKANPEKAKSRPKPKTEPKTEPKQEPRPEPEHVLNTVKPVVASQVRRPAERPAVESIPMPVSAVPKENEDSAASKLSGDLFSLMSEPAAPKVKPQNVQVSVDTRMDLAWIPVKFEMFWKNYPRKVAKSDAVKAFSKIIKDQKDVNRFMSVLLASLEYWKTQDQWTKDKGKFIPYPASWLNAGHWKDSEENDPSDGKAAFLKGDAESDEDLLKRMKGG